MVCDIHSDLFSHYRVCWAAFGCFGERKMESGHNLGFMREFYAPRF